MTIENRHAVESDSGETNAAQASDKKPPGLIRIWIRRTLKLVVAFLAFYALSVVVGLIPVNSDFIPDENGVEIFIFSGAIHSDIILPLKNDVFDWTSEFGYPGFDDVVLNNNGQVTHLGFGWGDRGFYVDTPTWGDMKFSTAVRALCVPSPTVMHVGLKMQPVASGDYRSVKISQSQYRELCQFIQTSFAKDESGDKLLIEGAAYGTTDAFYKAEGNYHCFRTCNCWVGEAMRAAGIKTGWFTPLPKTVFFYLPE